MTESNIAREEVQTSRHEQDDTEYPSTKKVLPVMAAVWLAFFVVALVINYSPSKMSSTGLIDLQDRTIIGTAVPTISKDFDSFGDIAWYEAGFLFPLCVLQLSFGRIYTYYSTKWVLVMSVAVFEIGSLICATAPSSDALIVGRVVTGIGAAAIPPGCFVLISFLVPMQDRPKYVGSLGSVFGITSILGPILGGFLTSVSWRWCFWINLPVGGVSMVLLALLTPKCDPPVKRSATWKGKFLELDPLGFILIAPCLVCLLIAVQFGGTKYPWNSPTIIVLFLLFGLFGIAFIASQMWRGDKGTLPPRIILQRSILVGSLASAGIGSTLVIFAFFLPIWFQVIQGKSPQSSGLSLIPLLLSVVFAVIGGGIFTSTVGYYAPLLVLGSAIIMVGAGLISTWTVNVSAGAWIGFQVSALLHRPRLCETQTDRKQIITGIGQGLVLQVPNIAAQTVLPKAEVSTGLAIMNLFNFLGASLFVTVGQTLFENGLIKGLQSIIPDLDPNSLSNGGATSIRSMVPKDQLPIVLKAYNDAMRSIWYLAIGLAGIVFVVSLGLEWKSVKNSKVDVEQRGKDETEVAQQQEKTTG